MKHALLSAPQDTQYLPKVPSWAIRGRGDSLEEAAFASGAALAALDAISGREDIPLDLLRERLCLRAAEACVSMIGRTEPASALRDEVQLLRAGDQPGPAGAILVQWRRAAARRLTGSDLLQELPEQIAVRVPEWIASEPSAPIARASHMLEAVLSEFPHEETLALILADASLSRALGWRRIMPLLAFGLHRRHLRKEGESLRLACHRAVATSSAEALRQAADLARRASQLVTVAPKLRARGSDEAVALFLSTDAVSPTIALTAPGIGMSDRAARRFCDRLVELGVVRELTGRATFRLYGL